MYQPYPGSGQQQPPEPQQRPPVPNSVQTAVKLMYAGAGLSLIELIVGLATVSAVRRAIVKAYPHYTSSQIHRLEVADVAIGVIVGLIAIGLWIWMARACGSGRNWARITGTVFFGLNTLFLVIGLARPHASVGLIFNLLVWLAGLGAVIMLWRRESGLFFNPRTQ
ncbi:MAG TPA: hypothetical protein VMI33_13205 [Streptosporangiaceae bacterium]|nr:hypothetical protein [Streptosporangiaceae bacterium]